MTQSKEHEVFLDFTRSQALFWEMVGSPDLKLGIGEKTVFSEFHPDAEDLFNVTCDLKLVCEKLHDRNVRYKRQVCWSYLYFSGPYI